MSCYNWERGTIKLPTKEWPKFRKSMIKLWNDRQLDSLAVAKKAHEKATLAAKGKRGRGRQPLILAAIAGVCGGRIEHGYFRADKSSYHGVSERNEFAHERWDVVTDLILVGSIREGTATKTKNPQKKDLRIFPVSKSCTLSIGEGSVSFDNDTRSVVWDVYENNHAVERAHKHWLAQALFRKLQGMLWTRGTGGKIVGNDEYNRDSEYEGGGGNYVTSSFGPLGKTRGFW